MTRSVATVAGFALLLPSVALAASANEFEVFNYDRYGDGAAAGANDLPGRLYVPDDYDPSKSYALVTFFHGHGERGSAHNGDGDGYDNTAQVNGNIDNLLAAAKEHDFLLYAPQTWNGWDSDKLHIAVAQVRTIAEQYNVDTGRLYVTGLSMGGGGTWDTLSAYPHVFSAAAVICGVTNIGGRTKPDQLTDIPIWAYHAVNDGTVGVGTTRNMVNRIRQAKGLPNLSFPLAGNDGSPYYNNGTTFYDDGTLRYTEYPSGNHFIWGWAYGEDQLYDWMLSHARDIPDLQVGQTVRFDLGGTQVNNPDGDGVYWNSTNYGYERVPRIVSAFARTEDGEGTAVTLAVSDAFSGGNADTGDPIDGDGWYAASWDGPAELTLMDLVAGMAYDIELFATTDTPDGAFDQVSRYTIGSASKSLDYFQNTETVLFQGVVADADGTIVIGVMPDPTTNTRMAYLNWLSVTAVPEPTVATLLAPAALGLLYRRPRTRA